MGYDLLNPYSLILLANAVFAVALATYVSHLGRSRVTLALIVLLAGAAVWSAADALKIAALSPAMVVRWNQVSYFGAGVMPPAVVAFAAAYTGRDRWLSVRRLVLISMVSVAMVLTVFTNQWHGLWRSGETVTPGSTPPVLVEQLGALHMVWIGWVLLFIIPLTFGFFVDELRTNADSRVYRRRLGAVLLGLSAPVGTSVLFALRVPPVDLTPVGFTVFCLALTVAIGRYHFLDLEPIAQETVFEELETGVLVFDASDRIVNANPAACSFLAQPRDALIGQSSDDLLADLPDGPDYPVDELQADRQVTLDTAEGQEHYRVRISPISRGDNADPGRVVLFNEITEQIRRQRRLAEQNERLEEFAGLVSHDLRNPLQVVDSNLQLMEDPAYPDRVSAIEDAAERMSNLIDRILTVARTGEEATDPEPQDLATVAERAWKAVGTGDATVEVGSTRTVNADPGQLQQCLENLFRNSVEHGGPTVTVTVGTTADGFYVVDDGPGLPATEVGESPTMETLQRDGGYGLRIVGNVADAHGWDLTVQNGADGGARFEFQVDGDD